MKPDSAAFSFDRFRILNANIDCEDIPESIFLDFIPSGVLIESEKRFILKFLFIAKRDNKKESTPFISINCEAAYVFKDSITLENIPEYFYSNSIAIVFPYIRAFVSTITLQANIKPIVLPTLNLTALNTLLKENTVVK